MNLNEDKPIAYDICCGLGGWTEALLDEGYRVIGFDVEAHDYGTGGIPGELRLRDITTIHGSELKDAALIVCSPPCQRYSYMAMPWSRAKAQAAIIEADTTGEELRKLNLLFDTCFRLQREASEAAGRHIPMIVENVRGAQKWVGKAAWNYGSFYLWGDVPALMPIVQSRKMKTIGPVDVEQSELHNCHINEMRDSLKVPGFRFDGSGKYFQTASVEHIKIPSDTGRRTDPGKGARFTSRDCGVEGLKVPGISLSAGQSVGFNVTAAQRYREGTKQAGISGPRENGKGDRWFQDGAAAPVSRSNSRKAASAMIAKIPYPLAQHIARVFKPRGIA